MAATTIAYGPADDNGNADVICQLFIEQVLRGASLGRALLEARLGYVRQQSVVDPYDEKTLAQFVLLGDPSLHPFVEAGGAEDDGVAGREGRRACRAAATPGPPDEGRRAAGRARRAYTVPAQVPQTAAGCWEQGAGRRAPPLQARAHVPGARAGRRQGGGGQGAEDDAQGPARVRGHQAAGAAPRPKAPPRIDGLLAYQVNGELVARIVVSR